MDEQDLFTGTQEIAPDRAFDIGRLQAFMEEEVAGFSGTLKVREFRGGQSNPTYSLTAGGTHYVMRRKPPGVLVPSAHAVDREYKVITALAGTNVPVPRTYAMCTDESVTGTWFYIMDHADGRILWDNDLPGMEPIERSAIYESMIDILGRLHRVDHVAVGLADFGKPSDYVARQLKRFLGQYALPETRKIPEMDWLAQWLPANIPPDQPPTIVHGDFKLANFVLHETKPEVTAILDWELSTIGNPLVDLACHCMPYHLGADTHGGIEHLDLAALGIPSEADHLRAYCAAVGRERIRDWSYYMALVLFRNAVISLGILARADKGTAASDHAREMGMRAWPYSAAAWKMAQKAGA